MSDFDIHKTMIKKGIEFKVKNGELTEEQAKETVSKYESEFKEGKSSYDTPYYYLNEDTNLWIVKNKSTGKVLKSINYTPVNFDK